MIFYHSGINEKKIFDLLNGVVTDFLVDEIDIRYLPPETGIGVLDSGAYRLYKKSLEIVLENYLAKTREFGARCARIVAPDVIGDPERSLRNYEAVKSAPHLKNKLIPVWGWDAPREYLDYYLSEQPLVGIGGLARIFHDDKTPEEKKRRERVLSELLELCREYPQRFHIFGLNFLKAIEVLSPFLFSGDSSVFLRGRRKRFAIFVHEKNKHLTQAPAKFIPQYAALSPDELCRMNAKNIADFVKQF